MSNNDPILLPGDPVYYVGDNERIKKELTSKDGKPFRGWIHAPVQNEDGVFVVEFPDTKEYDSYIMKVSNLSKARPQRAEQQTGPEVQPRRKKKEEME